MREAPGTVRECAGGRGRKLFRLLIFVWWTGNGDMHLENFSLLRGEDGNYRLSPAYDLLCTRLVIGDDPLALSVGGKKKNVTHRQWMQFAEKCGIRPRVAEGIVRSVVIATDDATALIARSALPDEMKSTYETLIRSRAKSLRR